MSSAIRNHEGDEAMRDTTHAFQRRLSRVRRRWKAAAALDGALLVATEALGLFLIFMLADAIYNLSGEARLGMLGAGAAVLAALFAQHVVRPMLRRIPDEQIALYVEERSPNAEGAVVSALECKREAKGGFAAFIARFLVADAVERIDRTNRRAFANLGRLKKHLLVACGLLAAYGVAGLAFPRYVQERGERIIVPWESIRREREDARSREETRLAQLQWAARPIEIDLQPKGMSILRGKGIEFAATLSRRPPSKPVFHYQFAGAEGKEHAVEMEEDQARFGYRLPFRDINESFTYYVAAGPSASQKYEIKVYDPLAVRGIELTCHYPEYLQRDPQSSFGSSGDVTALAGTRVAVKVVANNPLKSGTLTLDNQATVAMTCGAKAQDGATGSFTVQKDGSYTYEVTDVYGGTVKLQDFFFIKAVPDNPPTVAMASPKVDMSVHPLCEVTFAAEVADDFAIKDVATRLNYYRDGKPEAVPLAMKPPAQGDFRNFLSGKVQHVLELEKLTPRPKVGDMMFYYMEVTDRKGQSAKTDLFFIRLMPLEVAAAWPENPTPPDLPHWDYLWTPDIILLAAAAWNIEQQRGKIPTEEFSSKCTELAGRMEPAMNSQRGLNLLGGKRELPREVREAAGPIIELALKKLRDALQLVRDFQPGKAALLMQEAMALGESLNTQKGLQEIEMAQAPIHTGQPSGGYNQDAVQEQMEFRVPGVMSDSLTNFQQEDNPRHFLPPDYRRALRLKERTAPLTKELKLAGEIYASQEQLIEMAREAFGHRKLREAAEMSCTNDPAAGTGTRGEMIRVDKRAVPWASMDPRADLPDIGNKGQMKQPKAERIKGLKYARLHDNERDGPGSPHRSQTPGGSSESEEDQQPEKPKDPKKLALYNELWKVEANDRRPRQSQGGGGSSSSQQQQQPQVGMEQSQQQPGGSSGSAEQQLAARQADLANRAASLARDLSRAGEPGDPLAQRAATGLRDASAQMRQAAASFQRGDLQAGVAQARQAQQALRSAMHGMRAAQYGTLGEALAVAQQGAAALTENQHRVSQGTRQLEHRVRELSGEAAEAAQPGTGQPGKAEPGTARPGQGQPGQGQAGKAQPGEGRPGETQPGKAQPGEGQPGKSQPGKAQPGEGQPGKAQPGEGRPGESQPGEGQPGKSQPGKAQPGEGRPGEGQPAEGQAEKGQPGKGARVAGPSRGAIDKAKAQDPRIAAKMQGLAGEQLKLSESLKEFEAYVGDLVKWSQEADKERVTTSLRDVTDGLKQDGVAQKMVDAGVDLSQQDIGSARATQDGIQASLDRMGTRLREANDMLDGSKTGIIGRTARQAREVGEGVRRVAGLPQRGAPGGQPSPAPPGAQQPGEGQPGQAQPGEGQPGQAQPGEGQPGQAQPGEGQPGQAQPGAGQPPKGQPGRREDSLAQRLAAEEQGRARSPGTQGQPGPGTNVPGGKGGPRDELDELWVKARDLSDTLEDEQLAEQPTLDYLRERVSDPTAFRQMFDKVKKAEAGKFADVVTGVGKSLDEVLKETLSAKKLHSERGEECPPQYRAFVDAYFEALSKAATGK
jgi:hypothetical protein